jgi:protein SCO1/2
MRLRYANAIPLRQSMAAVGLAAVLAAGCGMEAAERTDAAARQEETGLRGIVTPAARPDFVLTDASGEPYDFAEETSGKAVLLFFGYTYCPDVCPIHMSSIAEVKRDLGVEVGRSIEVVFVTVDPDRDTPERLEAWLGAFDPAFVGLRGTTTVVDSIQLSLGLPPAVIGEQRSGDYDVGHASPVLAFSADDRLTVRYPHGTRQEDWRHDLPILAGLE